MAVPTIKQRAIGNNGAVNVNNFTPPFTTGSKAVGDMMIVALGQLNATAFTLPTNQTGWTLLGSTARSTTVSLFWYWKRVVTAGEINATWTKGSTQGWVYAIWLLGNVDPTQAPGFGGATNAATTAPRPLTYTTAWAAADNFFCAGYDAANSSTTNQNAAPTTPAGGTGQSNDNANTQHPLIGTMDWLIPSTATFFPSAWTISAANAWAANSVAVKGNPSTAWTRSFADAMAPADVSARARRVGQPFADAMAPLDTAIRLQSLGRQFADATAPADVSSQGLQRGVTAIDTLVPTDVETNAATRPRSYADALAPTDATVRIPTKVIPVADPLASTDAQAFARIVAKAFADSNAPADALAMALARTRSYIDALAPTDVLSRAQVFARGVPDTLAPTDANAFTWTYGRSYTDALGLTDAESHRSPGLITKALTDSLSPLDQLASILNARRSFSDTLAPLDTHSKLQFGTTFTRSFADALAGLDSAAVKPTKIKSLADALAALDIVTRFSARYRTVTETFEPRDVFNSRRDYRWRFIEDTGLTDAQGVLPGHVIVLPFADLLAALDVSDQALHLPANIAGRAPMVVVVMEASVSGELEVLPVAVGAGELMPIPDAELELEAVT